MTAEYLLLICSVLLQQIIVVANQWTKDILQDVVKTLSIVKQALLFVEDVRVNKIEEVIKGVCTCIFNTDTIK